MGRFAFRVCSGSVVRRDRPKLGSKQYNKLESAQANNSFSTPWKRHATKVIEVSGMLPLIIGLLRLGINASEYVEENSIPNRRGLSVCITGFVNIKHF